jgi:hypothetical protein
MRSWLVVILITLLLLGWVQLIHTLVGDRDRTWDYGSQAYIPGDSRYSTEEPPLAQPEPPRQIAPIPQPPPAATKASPQRGPAK